MTYPTYEAPPTPVPTPTIPTTTTASFFLTELSFADDAAYVILACATDVRAGAKRAIEIVYSQYALHGLRINVKPHKTSAIISITGPGSRALRRHNDHLMDLQLRTDQGEKVLPLFLILTSMSVLIP